MITPRAAAMRTAAIVVAFAAVLLVCASQGAAHRRYAAPPAFRSVPDHLSAYKEWVREGVKGRVLCLFDRRAFVSEKGEEPNEDNYLDLAVRHGIVRRVYHFVPASAWGDVQDHLRGDPRFTFDGSAFVYPMEEGRLIVTTLDHLDHFDERVLAIVNPVSWSGAELERVGRMLRDHRIDSDLAMVLSPPGFAFPGEP